MPSAPPVIVRAYAKVNLDLRILGERPDGYHEVRTILQTLRLHDTLTFITARGPFGIECDTPEIPTGPSNLIWRAADLLARLRGGRPRPPSGVRVRLVKRIPAQAGLGGGSADAAATLTALARLWNVDVDLSCLARLGAELGADVPFFLGGGTALGCGRGDDISPLQEPPATSVIVVKPPFGVSTPEAYRWFDEDRAARSARRPRPPLPGWPAWAKELRNDLEGPVARRHPAIGRLTRLLATLGADHTAMSGSGSAVFGLFSDRRRAAAAHHRLTTRGWDASLTHTLARAAVARQRNRLLGLAAGLAGGRKARID